MKSRVLNGRFTQLFLASMIVFATLVCIYPTYSFIFQWGESFANHIMLGFLILGLAFFFINQSKLMLLSFAGCAILCLFLFERTQGPLKPAEQTNGQVIKIANFNLSYSNEPFDTTLHLFLDTKADIISIQEITRDLLPVINDYFMERGYTYQHYASDNEHFLGMGIYSKFEFEDVKNAFYQNLPNIIGKITLPSPNAEEGIYFISSYIYPALDRNTYQNRKQHLNILSQQSNEIEEPLIVFGDYNLVPWSSEITEFKKNTALRDSRRGILPTSPRGFFSLFDRPADHIFYSNHFKCISFETISSPSTHHLGILGTYQFINNEADISNAKQTSSKL